MIFMSRAERRRQRRENEKSKTATYNFTEEQLDQVIQDAIGKAIDEAKQDAADEACNYAMILLLSLPMKVLMDHYWTKSYEKRLPEFTKYVLEYYNMWQNGEIDIDELREDLWAYAGVKIEEEE